MNFSRLSRFALVATLAILAAIATSMFFAISASNLQTQSEIKAHLSGAGEKNIMSSNREQTLQFDPKLREELVDRLNKGKIAELFKEFGLLKIANVKFELIISPKEPLLIDNLHLAKEGPKFTFSLLTSSYVGGCYEICDPCPVDPSIACTVEVDCNTTLH